MARGVGHREVLTTWARLPHGEGRFRAVRWRLYDRRARRRDLVLTIRLARIGKKKKPFYRVVVIERTRPRNGRVKELVTTLDPLKKPAEIKLDAERIKYWMVWARNPATRCGVF